MMKKLLIPLGAAALLLSACADDGNFYAPHSRAAVGYDAYYDNFYGPFYDGYWGPSDTFYYRTGRFGFYHPDRGMHFRHQGGTGFHDVHGHHR